jgi:hypothetical protein
MRVIRVWGQRMSLPQKFARVHCRRHTRVHLMFITSTCTASIIINTLQVLDSNECRNMVFLLGATMAWLTGASRPSLALSALSEAWARHTTSRWRPCLQQSTPNGTHHRPDVLEYWLEHSMQRSIPSLPGNENHQQQRPPSVGILRSGWHSISASLGSGQ